MFLDTRTKAEFVVSHIANAEYVGYKDFSLSKLADLEKDHPVILYCAVGKRSDAITKKLISVGFTNVQNLVGGIFEWVNEGYPVVNSQNQATDNVHGYNRFFGFG